MYRLNPEPIPSPWPLNSFRYYDNCCSVMNHGGHKNADALREEYRHCQRAISHYWRVHMGVWRVYFNHKRVLMTPSKDEAIEKFEGLKAKCIALKEGNKGRKIVEDLAQQLSDKPAEIPIDGKGNSAQP